MPAAGGIANLPAGLSVANAKLPAVYENAQRALSDCASIDECMDWANKAEALASYARQADDDTLEKMCIRIKGRAVRRCGELLKQFNGQGARTDRPSGGGPTKLTQRQAAKSAHADELDRFKHWRRALQNGHTAQPSA